MALHLETFGRLRAYQDGTELDWLQSQRLRAALFTYLAIERVVQRATLVSVFWPESDEESARHALRQNLYQLRQVLGDTWVMTHGAELRVSDDVCTDAGVFEAALARDEFEAAARTYTGPFLGGVHPIDLKPWETWVDARRAHLAREFRRACREWVESCRARGDPDGAIEAAQCWTQPDPLDDEAQHKLIEVLAEAGRRTDALRQYEMYARLLEAEELEPLDETKALVERVEAEGAVGPRTDIGHVQTPAVANAREYIEIFGEGSGPAVEVSSPKIRRRWLRRAASMLLLVAVAAVGLTATLLRGDDLDAAIYLVGAPSSEASDAASLFRHHLDRALRRVPSIRAADPTRELVLRESEGDPGSDGGWLRRARAAGAGRLLRITALPNGSAPAFMGVLYDVHRRHALRDHTVHPASDAPADLERAAATLVEHLFDVPAGAIAHAGSRNDAAVRAFVSGMKAERAWDLEDAESYYDDAVSLDEAFARAHFRLAQIMEWTGSRSSDWGRHAQRATAASDALDGEEHLLARALVAMADERYLDACELYSTILAVDPFSFRAQFGLGNCHRADNAVVRDSTSPSGWSFRSSHNASVEAYVRAFDLEPGLVFTFGQDVGRLSEILYALPLVRQGNSVRPDTGRFAAFASLAGADTLGFLPYRWDEIQAARAPDPPRMYEAVERGKLRLLAVVAKLVSEFPDNPAALIARAEALEAVHSLDERGASALESARQARGVGSIPQDLVNAAMVEVRVLLKLERYSEARRVALETLDAFGDRDVSFADVAALAALTGQSSMVVRALEQGAVELQNDRHLEGVPLTLLKTRERLTALGMLGAWPDSIRVLADELAAQATAFMDPATLEVRLCGIMAQPLDYAYPVLRQPMVDPSCWTGAPRREAQLALSAGDRARVFNVMDMLDTLREDVPPDRLTIDVAFAEAWLINEAGDPQRAARRLDTSLGAFQLMSPSRLRYAAQLAGFVRAMALRADLAAVAGETAVAQKWASAVSELWAEADAPTLRSTASRMRALVRGL